MKPFDFNNDGKVDPIEKGLEYHIYQHLLSTKKKRYKKHQSFPAN